MGSKYSILADQYKKALLDDVMPFWSKHSVDREGGGFFTCLDRQGKVFDTDKFLWLQGRQVWTYAMLYDEVEPRQSWLDMVAHGVKFLLEHGRSQDGSWYFALDRYGKPLVQPYNIFSDCFAVMGLARYHKISGNEEAAKAAVSTYENILARRNNPKGKYEKGISENRPLKNFSLPMILCNLGLELEKLVPEKALEASLQEIVLEVMEVFRDQDTGLIYENLLQDGTFSDSFQGRLINPGHGIEAMWFVMDLARRWDDQALIKKTCETIIQTLEYGWDEEYGGIFYFLDIKGHPPQQLEWDQKLWWVHIESLVALSKGFALTGDRRLWDWFIKVHDWTWSHFPDPEHGEWFGYLNREGKVLLPLKGGKWKGCFHVPRGLYQTYTNLQSIKP